MLRSLGHKPENTNHTHLIQSLSEYCCERIQLEWVQEYALAIQSDTCMTCSLSQSDSEKVLVLTVWLRHHPVIRMTLGYANTALKYTTEEHEIEIDKGFLNQIRTPSMSSGIGKCPLKTPDGILLVGSGRSS